MWRHCRRALSAIVSVVDLDEAQFVVALVMVTYALWPSIGRLALVVPGAALLWMSMPSRAPFVGRHPSDDRPRSKAQ